MKVIVYIGGETLGYFEPHERNPEYTSDDGYIAKFSSQGKVLWIEQLVTDNMSELFAQQYYEDIPKLYGYEGVKSLFFAQNGYLYVVTDTVNVPYKSDISPTDRYVVSKVTD